MFCRNCANQVDDKAVACPKCGVPPRNGTAFCGNCGNPAAPGAVVCTTCGVSLAVPGGKGAGNKIAAGICGILLGSLGVHKFILGYTKEGVIMLLISVLTCGFGAAVPAVIGLIEGIIYLTKSDQEFEQIYVLNKKGWF